MKQLQIPLITLLCPHLKKEKMERKTIWVEFEETSQNVLDHKLNDHIVPVLFE